MALLKLLQPLFLPFAKRFVAGSDIDRALRHVQGLNDDGITGMVDILGEHVERKPMAENALTEYVHLLNRMREEDVDGGLSIKLTHLGLEIGEEYCRSNVHHLLEHAASHDRFVWIDMESSAHTDETLTLYKELRKVHDNIGICLQSYLKRTDTDLQEVLDADGIIRLVKGAYDEPRDIAYREKEAVREHYRNLLDQLFAQDNYFAVATHDEQLIEHAQGLESEYDKDRDAFEFQFLMGVRNQLKQDLAADGYNVAEYVPYGDEWLPYYWRRVQERRENLTFALTAVLHSILGR